MHELYNLYYRSIKFKSDLIFMCRDSETIFNDFIRNKINNELQGISGTKKRKLDELISIYQSSINDKNTNYLLEILTELQNLLLKETDKEKTITSSKGVTNTDLLHTRDDRTGKKVKGISDEINTDILESSTYADIFEISKLIENVDGVEFDLNKIRNLLFEHKGNVNQVLGELFK